MKDKHGGAARGRCADGGTSSPAPGRGWRGTADARTLRVFFSKTKEMDVEESFVAGVTGIHFDTKKIGNIQTEGNICHIYAFV